MASSSTSSGGRPDRPTEVAFIAWAGKAGVYTTGRRGFLAELDEQCTRTAQH